MFPLPSPNHYDPATVTHYRTPRGGNPMDRIPSPDQINAMFDVLEELRQRRQEPEEMPELPAPHYHVVAFTNGCLNDYDSGPIETWEDAQSHLVSFLVDDYVDAGHHVEARDVATYVAGPYVLTVEECTEDCAPEADY